MKSLFTTCAVAALAAGAACGDEVLARSVAIGLSLDLSPVWEIASTDDPGLRDLPYSAKGWEESEKTMGIRVRLVSQYGALSDGVFTPSSRQAASPLTDWKTDRGTYTWTPAASTFRGLYRLQQETDGTQPYAQMAKLQAFFSFAACANLRPTDAQLLAAVGVEGADYSVSADQGWLLVGGFGEGVRADSTATFRFTLAGSGTLAFDYRLETGASLAVFVDGVRVESLTGGEEWMTARVTVPDDDDGSHLVELRCTASGGAQAFVRTAAYRRDLVSVLARARSQGCFFDIVPTNSWHEVASRRETVSLQYSCTNWTGVAGAKASSTVRITTYPLSPDGLSSEDRRDYWKWTPGAATETQTFEGEGSVVWQQAAGVWKFKKEILDGVTVRHCEEAILEVTFPGLMLIVR